MMKTSFKLIIAALATAAALAACTKEVAPPDFENDKVAPAAEGIRVIAVSFGPQTRTTLDKNSLQPMFADGDSILLATVPDQNSLEAPQDTQTVAVTVDPTTQNATISTRLFGDLKALYPAQKAEKVKETFDILVSAEQSGKFEDANICQAEISSGSNTAQFTNMYALFKIKSPDAPQSLTIKSLSTIGTDGQRTGTRKLINGDGAYSVTVSTPILTMPDSTYYVAIIPGVNLSDLSFEVEYSDEGTGAVKGIPTSVIQAQATALGKEYAAYNEVKPGTAYTIDDTNWHEYVTFAGHKWATMNIGANAPEEIGDYFVWGTTVKAYSEVNTTINRFTFVEENPYGDIYKNTWDKADGYNWNNTPFTMDVYNDTANTQVFYKYTAEKTDIAYNAEYDGKTILDLEDDAAYVNWGGAWRIPKEEEFTKYLSGSYEWDSDLKGLKISGVLFFPAVGQGGYSDPYPDPELNLNGLDLIGFGTGGSYCSSSVDEDNPLYVHCFYIDSTPDKGISAGWRYHGQTVRAIVDDPDFIATED